MGGQDDVEGDHMFARSKGSRAAQAAIPRSRVVRRVLLVSIATAAAAGLFLPFLATASSSLASQMGTFAYEFVGACLALSLVLTWIGFRWADRAGLPSPLLRPWEEGTSIEVRKLARALFVGLAGGVLYGAVTLLIARASGIPHNPGSFLVRIATTPFGALAPEVVSHLFLMSGLVLLFRGRVWPAVIVSAAVFVAIFHGGSVGEGWFIPLLVLALNFGLGLLLGVVYISVGLEAAVVGHAAAHFMLLAAG
jgi:hypothetical protein